VSLALKKGAGRTASDSGGSRMRSALVVSEVALSLMLLIGAGLLIRSLWRLRTVNPGFDANHVVTMYLSVAPKKFATPAQQISFFDRVLERVRALPGVQSAGVTDVLPLSGYGSHQPVQVEGRPVVAMADQPELDMRLISPGYMSTMHIPLLRGREFDNSDIVGHPGAVLISQSMAREFWPNQDPIGKRLTLYFFPDVPRVVVGVVGDVKLDALSQTRSAAAFYLPLGQLAAARGEQWESYGMMLAVRTNTDPLSVVSAIGNAVHEVDSEVPLLQIQTMQDMVDDSLTQQRFTMLLLAAFAGLALLLAGIGIYSVLSYAVRRRLREIGIRMALGAQVSDVLRMVVIDGMKPTLLGVVIGLAGALALGRVLASVLYGVSARDLATFGTVALMTIAVGLFASVLPAVRAARIDPIKTLRDE
ncbi:MAG: FtsX-like permease family protein, partial [Candidatus Korobacteraceae bacterium]